MSIIEQFSDGFENLLSEILGCGTDISNTVDTGHDCLFHELSANDILDNFCVTHTITHIFINRSLNKMSNMGINVRWLITWHQVNLFSALHITTKRSIVLKTIASSVLMDWLMRNEFRWIFQLISPLQFYCRSQKLPWFICFNPQSRTVPWITSRIKNLLHIVINILDSLIQRKFVKTKKVTDMNLEPS
ncbi:hypothetical protein OGAPHI_006393 [Ogataea philodendri]|uniref:Uncharacterized protein n=1 Tax=Ogataea philodendri TaxID=1378263 RepID=A0A9P8NXF5_9ASCO|nr:uncharacterized protein OGAPHI_006393 [Ogataea philodendri]KAH3661545.1 hypothetical protein OGAPHI_006393 [Ogataea philodendri]